MVAKKTYQVHGGRLISQRNARSIPMASGSVSGVNLIVECAASDLQHIPNLAGAVPESGSQHDAGIDLAVIDLLKDPGC